MRKLWVSISGGRSSAYMAIKLKQEYSDRFDLIFVFANTGLEHEETLIFLDKVDRKFHLNTVWIEAVIDPVSGQGTRHKVVDFATACRDGRVFEEMINVYGIPNKAYPHCNRELKISAMNSYIKSIGWDNEFRAIGIRADEPARSIDSAAKERKLYPLIDFFPTDKQDVLDYFKGKDYDLQIPEHLGNCVTCWKKSDKKLLRLYRETPESFDFFARMERDKGLCGHNIDGTKRVFFRGNRGVADLVKMVDAMPELDFESLDRCATEECGLE